MQKNRYPSIFSQATPEKDSAHVYWNVKYKYMHVLSVVSSRR